MKKLHAVMSALAVLAVLTVALPCHASWISWQGTIDDDFMKSGNWSVRVPNSGDIAYFSNGTTAVLRDVHTVQKVYYGGVGGTLVIAEGGDLTTTQTNWFSYGDGTLIIDNGTYRSAIYTRLGIYSGATGTLEVRGSKAQYIEKQLIVGAHFSNWGRAVFSDGTIYAESVKVNERSASDGYIVVDGGQADITFGSLLLNAGDAVLRYQLNPFTPHDKPLIDVEGTADFNTAGSRIEIDLGDVPHGSYTLLRAGNFVDLHNLQGLVQPSSDSGYTTYEENGRLMLNVTRVVPEPTTLAGLAVLGVAGLVRRRRRRA